VHFLPAIMSGDTLQARWTALGAICFVSLIGVTLPFYVHRFDEAVMQGKPFRVVRAFATGLVCGVAFLHVLDDANKFLSRVTHFPMAEAVMLFGAFAMVMVEEIGSMSIEALSVRSQNSEKSEKLLGEEAGEEAGDHSHPGASRKLVVFAMEASIALHSILIGIGLGVITLSFTKVATLAIALLFHQFFEGVALGMVAIKAKLSLRAAWHVIATFCFSCPIGGIIGIQAASVYNKNDPETDWTLGVLNGFAAGMLVHIGFCELLAADFGEHSHHDSHQNGSKVKGESGFRVAKILALFAGGGVMTFIAQWA